MGKKGKKKNSFEEKLNIVWNINKHVGIRNSSVKQHGLSVSMLNTIAKSCNIIEKLQINVHSHTQKKKVKLIRTPFFKQIHCLFCAKTYIVFHK
jgi:hypothetical protein